MILPRAAQMKTGTRFFSQWPGWSQLYAYALAKEKGVAYWTNLRMADAEFAFRPYRRTALRLTWCHMGAAHPLEGDSRFFGKGTLRGDLLQIRSDTNFGPNYVLKVLYERHRPGDFYIGRSPANGLLLQLLWRFSFQPAP